MAVSSFSRPFQIASPPETLNTDRLDNLFAYKQANYDQGYLNVQASIQKLRGLDLIRPEDIEYRDKKIGELVKNINNYAELPLDDPKVVAQLTAEAASVAEDKDLMSRLQSTANARSLISKYQKMRENPKLIPQYSAINESKQMQEYQDWIDGKRPNMTQHTPIFKVDIDGKAGNIFKQLAPTLTSTKDGLSIVQGEYKTKGDLKVLASGLIQSDPDVSAQLARNAEYLYKNVPPEDVYEAAIRARTDDIRNANEDLVTYEAKIKESGLTNEQTASLTRSINTLKGRITESQDALGQLAGKYSTGQFDPNEVAGLKYQLYTANWMESVSQPYVVNREKITPNQAAIAEYKVANDAAYRNAQLQQAERFKQIDVQQKVEERIVDLNSQLEKTGGRLNADKYRTTGEIERIGGVGSGGAFGSVVDGTLINTPTMQEDSDNDVISEMNSKVNSLKDSNRSLLTQATIDIIRKTDPTLAGKMDKYYKDNGSLRKFSGEMSEAQAKLLSNYDNLLKDEADPNKLKANPLLAEYGAVSNQITTNALQFNALEAERSKAFNQAFKDAKKEGFPGDPVAFKTLIDTENSSPSMLNIPNVRGTIVNGNTSIKSRKYTKMFNEQLRKSEKVNEFYTMKTINPEDKLFNDPSNDQGYYRAIQEYAKMNGVTINGKEMSINGYRAGNKTFSDDIPEVGQVRVDGVIPNTNQLRVTILKKDGDKKGFIEGEQGVIQMNPDQMNRLIGRNSDNQVKSIAPYLTDGAMVDTKGKPLYYNLNGYNQQMIGNIQYRFFDSGRNDRSLTTSILIPGNPPIEKHIPTKIFEGEGAHINAAKWLNDTYAATLQAVKARNPDFTDQQAAAEALKNLHKELK